MAYYNGRSPSPPHYGRSPSPSRQFYPDNGGYDYMKPGRPPSPSRGMPRQNNYGKGYNTRKVDPYDYGHNQRRFDYETGRGYGGPESLGRRRFCTAFLVILALLLLAGLAVGLYFAITKQQETAAANSPQKLVSSKGYNGYYVNGVYVVPVTSKPQNIYLIYGTDVPCNRFNNVTAVTPVYPNCKAVTTKIVLAAYASWTTLKPPVILVPVASAQRPPPSSLLIACSVGVLIYTFAVLDRGFPFRI